MKVLLDKVKLEEQLSLKAWRGSLPVKKVMKLIEELDEGVPNDTCEH